jgi:hypothetical protein
LTASSTASLAILIMSSVPFRYGSASRSYGFGGGESSAASQYKFVTTEAKTIYEAKSWKIPISLAYSAASSAFLPCSEAS